MRRKKNTKTHGLQVFKNIFVAKFKDLSTIFQLILIRNIIVNSVEFIVNIPTIR